MGSSPLVDDLANSNIVDDLKYDTKEGDNDEEANFGGLTLEEVGDELHLAEGTGDTDAKKDCASQNDDGRGQDPPRLPQTEVLLVELDVLRRNRKGGVTVRVQIASNDSKQDRRTKSHGTAEHCMRDPKDVLGLSQLKVLAPCKNVRPAATERGSS